MSIDSMMTPAPSQRRNPWFAIIFFTLIVWTAATGGLAAWSFEWLSPTLWANVDHLYYWLSLAKSFFSETAKTDWQGYIGWIDRQGLNWHLYLHVGIPATIGVLPAIGVFFAFYTPGGSDSLRHISGPLLYRYRQAVRNAKWKLWWRYAFDPMGKGVEFYPGLYLPMRREPQNLLYLGMPGTGKTQTMNRVIKQAIDRGDRVLIYDEKKEFTEFFYGYGENKTLLIAPWDKRSVKWNIASDCRNKSQAQLFANRSIPVNEKDPIWGKGVRQILTGGIVSFNKRYGRKWGFEHLADFKNMEIEEMEELMKKHYPPAARFIKENSKTSDSFLMNLGTDLGWLDDLAEAWPKSWENGVSIRNWTKNDDTKYRTIILQNDSEYPDVAEPVVNVLIALVTSALLKMSSSQKRCIWLFLDEIGNLPKNPALLKWMSLARAKGGRMVLGIQDLAMMAEVYGTNILQAKKSMIGTVIALPVSESSDTAEDTAKALGKRNIERPQSTRQADGSVSVTWQAQNDLPLVTASELSNLPEASPRNGIHGYVKINGLNTVYQLRWPLEPMAQIAEGDMPADWTIPPDDDDEDSEHALMAAMAKPVEKTKEKSTEQEESYEDDQFFNDPTLSSLDHEKESDIDHLATEAAEGMLESQGLGGVAHALELFSETSEVSTTGDNNSTQSQSDNQRRGRKRRKEAEIEHE